MPDKRRCKRCGHMTRKWQRVNGSFWHCYDGCYSTTGYDYRTEDGQPLWLKGKSKGKIEFGNLVNE